MQAGEDRLRQAPGQWADQQAATEATPEGEARMTTLIDEIVDTDGYCDTLSFHGFEVCFAGSQDESLVFGSEDGKLIFADRYGKKRADTAKSVSESEEAINGYAKIANCHAISTRHELTLIWNLFNEGPISTSFVEHSVHGVIATANKIFVAPAGRSGLMFIKPSNEQQEQSVLLSNDSTKSLYFYSTIALLNATKEDVIVSAMRSGGVAAGVLSSDLTSHRVQRISPKDIDVIDVCSLDNSLAVAVLGKDGTILIFRDILKDRKPHQTKFKLIDGVAYRILHSHGHLFVLTSKGFFVLANLASMILSGKQKRDDITQILRLPMSAVDATVHMNRNIYIVNDSNEVLRLKVSEVENNIPHENQEVGDQPDINVEYPAESAMELVGA